MKLAIAPSPPDHPPTSTDIQILFLSGLPLIIGPTRTFYFFSRREKWRGTVCFFGGMWVSLEQADSGRRAGSELRWSRRPHELVHPALGHGVNPLKVAATRPPSLNS